MLISAPFLAGVGGVYLLFLNKHDINFYLVDQPPEFWWTIAIGGLLMMIGGLCMRLVPYRVDLGARAAAA